MKLRLKSNVFELDLEMVVGKKVGMIKVKVRTTEKGEKGRGLEDWVGQREVGDLLY